MGKRTGHKIIGFIAMYFLLYSLGISKDSFIVDETGFRVRVLENRIFGPGERFLYDVYYGVIPAGSAGIELLPETITYRQAPCYQIHTWARSAKAFDLFFKVRDEVNAYMDSRGIFTWYFRKQLREGKYRDLKVVDYDQRSGLAYLSDEGVPDDTSRIPLYVQDAISALYYFRLQPIESGQSLFIPVHDIRRTYNLRVDILGREMVKTPAGNFECYKVEPVLESAGIFKSKGRIWIWFTTDEKRIPVKMQTKILIGSITAYMKKYVPAESADSR